MTEAKVEATDAPKEETPTELSLFERCEVMYGNPRKWAALSGLDADGNELEFVFLRSKLNEPAMYDVLLRMVDEAKDDPQAERRMYEWCADAAIDQEFGGGRDGLRAVCDETRDFKRICGMHIFAKMNADVKVAKKA